MAEVTIIEAGVQKIVVHKDLRVPMRDGVELAADAYHGVEDKPRPALVALSPYGKELQALALTTPPQRRPSPMWDGCIEAGDIARVVAEDYVHVIGDLRGSGGSEGEHIGNYNAGGESLGQDAYDFIEWVAAQPWCDGNVGMIGISYFGSMQVLAAAERPPSLKAIFVSGGHYNFYETTYHGGVMWFMPRAASISPIRPAQHSLPNQTPSPTNNWPKTSSANNWKPHPPSPTAKSLFAPTRICTASKPNRLQCRSATGPRKNPLLAGG